jgi:uncharacterized membrane protein
VDYFEHERTFPAGAPTPAHDQTCYRLSIFLVTVRPFTSPRRAPSTGSDHCSAASVPQAKGARRNAWQVLANGGPATLLLALREPGGFVSALATAAADTWATEVGMCAGRTPRSILTLRRVAPGTSGGVTPEGTLAGILGALAVGLSFVLGSQHARQRRFFAATASGLAGCVLESVVGETLQALYRCPACDVVLESPRHAACGAQATLVPGWPTINNDAVNAIATTFDGVLGTRLIRGPRRSWLMVV